MSRFIIFLIFVCLFIPTLNTGHITVRSKCNRFWKRVTGHMSNSVLPNRTITFNGLHPCSVCFFTYPVGSNYVPVGDYHLIQHYSNKCPIIHENHMTFRTSTVSLTCTCNISTPKKLINLNSKTLHVKNLTEEFMWERNGSSKFSKSIENSKYILQKKLASCLTEVEPLPRCVPKFGSIDLNIENLTTSIKSIHKEGQDSDSIQMSAEIKNLKNAKISAIYNGLVMKALRNCYENVNGFYEFLITNAVHNFFTSDSRDSFVITELDKNLTCTLY